MHQVYHLVYPPFIPTFLYFGIDHTMSSKPVKIVFTPSGIRGEVEAGTDILTAARMLGADLDTVCGGTGICGRCKVQLSVGAFPKHGIQSQGEYLSSVTSDEDSLLGTERLQQ